MNPTAQHANGDSDPAQLEQHQQVVTLLKTPSTYADAIEVRVIETHISRVFLTEHHAYKLKKPVNFGFLDFSTSDKRGEACRAEVQLNRRLAPHVYLGVVAVTKCERPPGVKLDGDGEAVDWVVKMRRLPEDRTLELLIARQALKPEQLQQVAALLQEFYVEAERPQVTIDQYCRQLLRHIQDNRSELLSTDHAHDAALVKRIHGAQLRFVHWQRDLLDERVRAGRIVDGHGDLRPEHVYLSPEPAVIDCLEFSAELRQVDEADELSFLAMELDRLQAQEVGQELLQRYAAAAQDVLSDELVCFYKSYRACVRAKVESLRGQQMSASDRKGASQAAREYLRLADGYTAALGPAVLLVVRGLSGTGKSTLASRLAEQLGAELLQTDTLRKEVLPGQADDARADFNEGRYSEASRARVYAALFDAAEHVLADQLSVVLDGTFLSTASRRSASELAERHRVPIVFVHCRCDEHTARQRVARRQKLHNSPSEIRPELLLEQAESEQPDPPSSRSITVDTSRPVEGVVADALAQIPGLL